MYSKLQSKTESSNPPNFSSSWKLFGLMLLGLIVCSIGWAALDLSTTFQYFRLSTSGYLRIYGRPTPTSWQLFSGIVGLVVDVLGIVLACINLSFFLNRLQPCTRIPSWLGKIVAVALCLVSYVAFCVVIGVTKSSAGMHPRLSCWDYLILVMIWFAIVRVFWRRKTVDQDKYKFWCQSSKIQSVIRFVWILSGIGVGMLFVVAMCALTNGEFSEKERNDGSEMGEIRDEPASECCRAKDVGNVPNRTTPTLICENEPRTKSQKGVESNGRSGDNSGDGDAEFLSAFKGGTSTYKLNSIFGMQFAKRLDDVGTSDDDNSGTFTPEKPFLGFRHYRWNRTPKSHAVYAVGAVKICDSEKEALNDAQRVIGIMEDKYGASMFEIKRMFLWCQEHKSEMANFFLLAINAAEVKGADCAYAMFFNEQETMGDLPDAWQKGTVRTVLLVVQKNTVAIVARDIMGMIVNEIEKRDIEKDAL